MRKTISTDMSDAPSTAADHKSIALDLSTVKTSSETPARTRPRIFGLQEAPTYYPTAEEFNNDPIQYIQKIRPEAEEFGIIKIVPPPEYKPGFALNTEAFRFRTRLQKLNSMEGETRANVNYLEQLYNFHRLNGHPVNKVPQLDRRPIDLFKLKKEVAQRGGYQAVTQQKKWAEVGRLLGYSREQCTSMSNALKSAYTKLILPYEMWLAKHKQEEAARKESPPSLSPSSSQSNSTQQGCEICHTLDNEDEILLCDGCDRGYHMACLTPPLTSVPASDWYCVKCLTAAGEDYGFEDGDEYTLQEFQKVCDKFKTEWFANKCPQPTAEQDCEDEFWRLVENPHETCEVEYGADLHSTQHGSAFPPLEPSVGAYQRWNLNMIPVLPTSLFSHIKTDISGMMVPWLYIGMCFSAFCWHNEDHYTYSINYMHWGETKTWYGVPGSDTDKFENTMRAAVPELFEQQPDLLFQLTTMLSPGRLLKEGVRVFAVDQRPGQFVVTFPKAYHSGFNHGFNFCEAVNFAPWEWIDYGLECAKRYKQYRRQPCFSHDELLVTTARMDHSLEAAMWLKAPLLEMQERELETRQRLLKKNPRMRTQVADVDVSEEQQQCFLCNEYTYLSRVTCECNPTKVACADHAAQLCRCDMTKRTLHLRFTDAALRELAQPVLQRAYQPSAWSDMLQELMRTQPEPSLRTLSDLLAEAEQIAVPPPEAKWLREYVTKATQWINAANACQQRCRERRPRGTLCTGGNYTRICELLDELRTIAFSAPEVQSLRETHRILTEFQAAAARVLANDAATMQSYKDVYEAGVQLGADMDEFQQIERRVLRQAWYEEACEASKDPTTDYDKMVRLVHEAEVYGIPPDDRVYASIIKNRDQGAAWAERAQSVVRNRGLRVTADSVRDLISDSRSVPRVPNLYNAVNDLAGQAFETMKQVDRAFERAQGAKDVIGRPSVEKMRALLKKTQTLPIEMESGTKLQDEIARVDDWVKRLRALFEREPTRSLEELLSGMDQSALTITKAALTQRNNVYCLCRLPESGRMIECDMCHEWYHIQCLRLSAKKTAVDASFICPVCDGSQPVHHLTKHRPSFDDINDLVRDAESLLFCPREIKEIKLLSRIATRLWAYREYLQAFCRSKPHLDQSDLPTIRQHLRELEGLEVILADERDFLRQKLQSLAPYVADRRTTHLVSGPVVEPSHCHVCDAVEHDHSLMLACDACYAWFHMACIEDKDAPSSSPDHYVCVACSKTQKRPRSIKLRINPPNTSSPSPPSQQPPSSSSSFSLARATRRRKLPDSPSLDAPSRKQPKA